MVKIKVPYLKHLTDGILQVFFKYVNMIKIFECKEQDFRTATWPPRQEEM